MPRAAQHMSPSHCPAAREVSALDAWEESQEACDLGELGPCDGFRSTAIGSFAPRTLSIMVDMSAPPIVLALARLACGALAIDPDDALGLLAGRSWTLEE